MEVLGILLLLAFLIAWSVAFFLVLGARSRITALELQLKQLQDIPVAPPSESPVATETVVQPAAPAPVPEAPAVDPVHEPAAATEAPPNVTAASTNVTGLEERFGTRWVVWVGGLALALGGIFLVRYSIEQGLIGPGLRTLFGALFAAALIAAGEWQRRQEQRHNVVGIPAAHIPSILTAAGTAVAFATVYAAYSLYGFIGPVVAFVLLGVVALATLAAALLHGPALAGLGLIGAYVTPALISTGQPNYWALYLYLIIVSAAAFTLARVRLWRWLAATAVALGLLWMLPGIHDTRLDSIIPHALYAAAGFALTAGIIVAGLLFGPAGDGERVDRISSAALVAYLLGAALAVVMTRHDSFALAVFAVLTTATVGIGWRTSAAMAAVPCAGVLTILVIGKWAVQLNFETLVMPAGPVAGSVPGPGFAATGWHLGLAALLAAIFGGTGFLAQGRYERALLPMLWAATGAVAPIGILIALYYRIAGFDRSFPFAGIALLLAGLYVVAAELLSKREQRPGLAAATAIFATAAIAALALALTFALEKGWLTVALALMVPGVAWVQQQRPLPALRYIVAVLVGVVMARIGWVPRIVGGDIGSFPIINWLLYGYGVPTLAFWTAGYLLRKRADDIPARMTDSAAILFTVLLGFFEIRHFMTQGEMYRTSTGLAEVALQVSMMLAIAIGLERLRARTGNIVHNVGALVIAGLALCGIVFGLIGELPLITGEPVGGLIFNLVLLGYGLPALLVIVLALIARRTRPLAYRGVAVVASVMLALLYLSLEVARFHQGPVLNAERVSNAEQYTYSVVWLAFGVTLLIVGMLLRSQPARLTSAGVIVITVAKVFVWDMAGLEGGWRALSFIGLGLVLIGIGWLYQRLLFPRPAVATQT